MKLTEYLKAQSKKLGDMHREPASKEWFAKHGNPHAKALDKVKKPSINAGTGRRLTPEEQKEKMKGWAKPHDSKEFPKSDKDKRDYQHRHKRAWNE